MEQYLREENFHATLAVFSTEASSLTAGVALVSPTFIYINEYMKHLIYICIIWSFRSAAPPGESRRYT